MNENDTHFTAFVKKHLFKILGGLIGIVLAVSFLYLGFFKTMLIVVMCILGVLAGMYFDHNRTLLGWISRTIERREDDPFR